MAVINFTLDGVPFVYNGQEIGDTTPQSIFARWPIRWEAACLPKPKKKLAFYKNLCRLRRDEHALTRGKVVWLDNDRPDSVVSFLRPSGAGEIVTVASLSNRKLDVRVELPGGAPAAYGPLLSDGSKSSTAEGKLKLDCEAFGYFVGSRQ